MDLCKQLCILLLDRLREPTSMDPLLVAVSVFLTAAWLHLTLWTLMLTEEHCFDCMQGSWITVHWLAQGRGEIGRALFDAGACTINRPLITMHD